jgi:hypothetical protein
MFPETNDMDAFRPEGTRCSNVARLVSIKLRTPEFAPRLRDMTTSITPMPEASIHEDCDSGFVEVKIRLARDVTRV